MIGEETVNPNNKEFAEVTNNCYDWQSITEQFTLIRRNKMNNNQHEQLTAEFEVPAFHELDDEVAATCSGGVQRDIYFGGDDPDVILYDSPNLLTSGATLHINAKALGGDDNLDNAAIGSGWNNRTSSIRVIRGEWLIYENGDQKSTPIKITAKGGPKKNGVYPNHKAFGLPDNSLTGIFRTEV
ncbi:hypothetical protein NUACC21_38800 [Scytonema sp. NUACC21]